MKVVLEYGLKYFILRSWIPLQSANLVFTLFTSTLTTRVHSKMFEAVPISRCANVRSAGRIQGYTFYVQYLVKIYFFAENKFCAAFIWIP